MTPTELTRQVRDAYIDGYLSAMDTHGWGGDRHRLEAEAAWRAENVTDEAGR